MRRHWGWRETTKWKWLAYLPVSDNRHGHSEVTALQEGASTHRNHVHVTVNSRRIRCSCLLFPRMEIFSAIDSSRHYCLHYRRKEVQVVLCGIMYGTERFNVSIYLKYFQIYMTFFILNWNLTRTHLNILVFF